MFVPSKSFLAICTKLLLTLSTIFLLSACGSGNDSGRQIPSKWLRALQDGTWRVEMVVLDSENNVVHEEAAAVDVEAGTVKSSDFKINPGKDYRFVALFHYAPNGSEELPVGMVAKFADKVAGEALKVDWEESDIFVSNKEIDSEVLEKIPAKWIPNLDVDGDGVSNLHEFIGGSDARSAGSVPPPPKLFEDIQVTHQENYLEFSVTFVDPLWIKRIQPEGSFGCGYYDWSVEDLSEGDETKIRLKTKYNLHAHDFATLGMNQVPLLIGVTNSLGFYQQFVFSEPFEKNGDAERWGPEIWVKRPFVNEVVTDLFPVEVEACDEDRVLQVAPQNVGEVQDLEDAFELFSGNLDVKQLTENATEITFVASSDPAVKSYGSRDEFQREVRVPIQVQPQSEIEVSPAPGQILRDNFELTAKVDLEKVPDLKNVEMESIEVSNGDHTAKFLDLTTDQDSTPEGFKGVQETTAFTGEKLIVTVHYKATAKSRILRRSVSYELMNSPMIKNFKMLNAEHPLNPCFVGRKVALTWKVENWNKPSIVSMVPHITLNSEEMKSENEWMDIVEESNAKEFQCESEITEPGAQLPSKKLRAIRVGKGEAKASSQNFVSEMKLSYVPLRITAFQVSDASQPASVSMSPDYLYPQQKEYESLKDLRWRLKVARIFPDGNREDLVFPNDQDAKATILEGKGLQVKFNQSGEHLVPRAKYEMTIELIGVQNKTYSTYQTIFYTGDEGLRGWWDFSAGISESIRVNNYAGYYAGPILGDIVEVNSVKNFVWDIFETEHHTPVYKGLKFQNDAANLLGEGGTAQSFPIGGDGFSFEALIRFDQTPVGHNPYMFYKQGDFALGYNNGKFEITMGLASCNDVGTKGFYDANKVTGSWTTTVDVPKDNDWHHLVVVYRSENKIDFYVDKVNFYTPFLQKISSKTLCSSGFSVNYPSPVVDVDPMDPLVPNLRATVGEMSYYDAPLPEDKVVELCSNSYPTPTPCVVKP